jgi:hypothetical protein
VSACEFTWCDARDEDGHTLHAGVLDVATADGNDIDVRIALDPYKGDELLSYSFEWDWRIDSGDAVREFAVLRSLLDQIEAVVTEAEKVYPGKLRALMFEVTA